jgi:uncharacterized protein (TIGR02647 family)
MPYTPDLVHELNTLIRFDLETSQQGIKVHKNADPDVIAATRRLHEKGLLTLADGGYLTGLGRDAAEHAQALLTILTSSASASRLRRKRTSPSRGQAIVGCVIRLAGDFQRAQFAEQFAVGARRLALLRFLQRVAAQLAQVLHVGTRIVARHFAEHRLVFHQARAQSFQLMLADGGGLSKRR